MARTAGAPGETLRALAGDLPAVVLAGRVNAGKSTLFNRLTGRPRAITSAIAGTTRDLNIARMSHDGREFVLVDSGGREFHGRGGAAERAWWEGLEVVARGAERA